VDAGKPGALRRACIEAVLPALLREMYPGWRVWEAAGRWHACRRGQFRQVYEAGALLFAVHAESPAGLWAKLVSETDKPTTVPMVMDAGERHHREEVPFCPARVHAPVCGRDGTSARDHLRLLP
jgi:hypothetical protein